MVQTKFNEFVSVIKLVHCYIATHFQENDIKFISEHPETDLKVAQASARSFAENQRLPYDSDVFEPRPNQPIITVIKHERNWYPTELYAKGAYVLLEEIKENSVSLAGNKKEAVIRADAIASNRGLVYKPSIGLSLERERDSEFNFHKKMLFL